jgi:hypothetical protein
MGVNDRNNVDDYDNAQIVIRDAVSNAYGAKVDSNNRLWVQSQSSLVPTGINACNSKLRYVDMNASNGGVARGTTITSAWTDVFSFLGNGYLFWSIINLETSSDWEIRIIIDSEELFGSSGITTNDIISNSVYDLDTSGKTAGDIDSDIGIALGDNDRIIWHGPSGMPVYFASSVVVKIKRRTGASNKKFNAGLICLTNGF